IRGSARLATDGIVGVVMALSRFLDHAVDDPVDSIARRQGPLVDVLELGRGESVLAQFLVGDVVSPSGRESPAIPVNGGRHRDDAIEVLPESLRHLVAFASAIGTPDVVVQVVLLPVIDLGVSSATLSGVMLTVP